MFFYIKEGRPSLLDNTKKMYMDKINIIRHRGKAEK